MKCEVKHCKNEAKHCQTMKLEVIKNLREMGYNIYFDTHILLCSDCFCLAWNMTKIGKKRLFEVMNDG